MYDVCMYYSRYKSTSLSSQSIVLRKGQINYTYRDICMTYVHVCIIVGSLHI